VAVMPVLGTEVVCFDVQSPAETGGLCPTNVWIGATRLQTSSRIVSLETPVLASREAGSIACE
jgi:hypothetical protein